MGMLGRDPRRALPGRAERRSDGGAAMTTVLEGASCHTCEQPGRWTWARARSTTGWRSHPHRGASGERRRGARRAVPRMPRRREAPPRCWRRRRPLCGPPHVDVRLRAGGAGRPAPEVLIDRYLVALPAACRRQGGEGSRRPSTCGAWTAGSTVDRTGGPVPAVAGPPLHRRHHVFRILGGAWVHVGAGAGRGRRKEASPRGPGV